MTQLYLSPELTERFWSKVDRSGGTDSCWPWTGGKLVSGYGIVNFAPNRETAHRVVWRLTHGPIPKGLFVCHHCDNPPCVNPCHLFLGDQKANMSDARQKMRTAIGERQGQARLRESQVREIVDRYMAGAWADELAAEFSVHQDGISRILRGQRWRHLWAGDELAQMQRVARSRHGRGRWRAR